MAWIEMTGRDRRGATVSAGDLPDMLYGEGRRPAPFIECDDRPTMLYAGPAGHAAELAGWAERAGFRCIGTVDIEQAAARIAMTIAVDLILVDLRDTCLDAKSARALALRQGLADTRMAVIADLDGLDSALSQLDGPGTEFLCVPDPSDIAGMLVMAAMAAERRRTDPQLHDSARAEEGARIEQLSEEVRRLAMTIDRLTRHNDAAMTGDPAQDNGLGARAAPAEEDRPTASNGAGSAYAPTHGEIRSMLRARRMRDQFLPGDLFADPAWDMILDLMAARLAGQRVSVSSLCIAAAVPPTTALRWIRQLTERGVFARIDDPADGRRVLHRADRPCGGGLHGVGGRRAAHGRTAFAGRTALREAPAARVA